jgi:hypothetical protein
MTTVPNHRERQYMQHLRNAGWVKAIMLPTSLRIVKGLLAKGWIERRGSGLELAYRMTDTGLEAKKAPVQL